MKIIVTGGSGMAGRHVVQALVDAGHEVTNLDRTALDGLPAETIQVDLTDIGDVYDAFGQVRPDGVCHLAANPKPGGFSRAGTFSGNVAIAYNVMQVAGDTGVHRFVNAGSEMATGWLTSEKHPDRFPFDESARVDSPNAYALSKYLSEAIADSMSLRYPDMPICTLRINNVIPPELSEEMLGPRRSEFPGPGSWNYWSYIDARDVGGAFRAALEGKSAGHEVYLIAAADTCIEVPIREAFKTRYGVAGNFAEGHGDFDSVFDCGKMRRDFGWEPQYSWRQA
jgi:nucleoside-diphosphate-sugar epimerase